ncbi:class I SAM-dependent methyltransferase [Patescibacteria group bacterium]|nr:class I SAM-dependent methyltransferase [Patescibacteria group bacterium]
MDISKIKQELKIAYDKDSKRRSDKDYKRDDWKIKLRKKFLDLLKKENKKTLLELGAGAGMDSKYFSENGINVLSTDLSEGMVNACKQIGLNAVVLDLYEISSLNKKFDAVFSMNVLLHVPKNDLSKVLKDIHNTLNKNGLFYYGVYGGVDEESTFTDNQKMGLPRFFSFLSDETITNLVKEFFEVIEFETVDIHAKREGFHYQSLILRKK